MVTTNLKEILDAATFMEKGSAVPQPAGMVTAEWYEKEKPTPRQMLYIIAILLGHVDNVPNLITRYKSKVRY